MTDIRHSMNLPAVDLEDDVAAIRNFPQALLFVHDGQGDADSDVWRAVHQQTLEISQRADRLQKSRVLNIREIGILQSFPDWREPNAV